MEDGFRFIWEPGQKPTMEAPDGTRIELEVQNFVPVMPVEPEPQADEQQDPSAGGDLSEKDADYDPLMDPNSPEHQLTHFPKLSKCEVCMNAKSQKSQHRKRKEKMRMSTSGWGRPQLSANSSQLTTW